MIPIAKPFIGEEEKKAILNVLDSGMIAQGPKVTELEQQFAAYCGSKYSVALNSGTAALHTGLHVMEIGKNDEVITTPFTFIATANVILMQQAKPVFADIDEQTFNIDPGAIQEKITDKTKAILTVDLYGQLCDYDKITKAAKKEGRQTSQGLLATYVHHSGHVASLVELLCETDFVARNELFGSLAHDLALQMAGVGAKDVKDLESQEFIKDPSKKVGDLVKEVIAKTGENIRIGRIFRVELGEE